MVKGPLTVTEIIAFHAGGYGFVPYGLRVVALSATRTACASRPSTSRTSAACGTSPSACTGTTSGRRPSATRWPTTTACCGSAWFYHHVADWAGDDGFIEKMSDSIRKFNYHGDTQFLSGKVVAKREEDGRYLVDLEQSMVSQRDVETAYATATVSLAVTDRGAAADAAHARSTSSGRRRRCSPATTSSPPRSGPHADGAIMSAMTHSRFDGLCIIDADTHLTEPHDLWTARRPRATRTGCPQVHEIDGMPIVDDGRQGARRAAASGVVGADGVKLPGTTFFQWNIEDVHAAAVRRRRPASRSWTSRASGRRSSIRTPSASAAQKFFDIEDETLRRLSVELYNDAMAEIQERVGSAAVPDGHRAVVGRRPRGRRDRADGRARAARSSTPRPRRTTTACPTSATSTGTRCGRRRAATSCRSTSTSAPATRRCRGSARCRGRRSTATRSSVWARR